MRDRDAFPSENTYHGAIPLRLSDLAYLSRPAFGHGDRAAFEDECLRRGLEWPPLAVEQFLFDHGNKQQFISQYNHLDLLAIRWELRRFPAEILATTTVYEGFRNRVESVAADPRWTLERYRSGHGEVFSNTWKVPPLVIEGALRNPPQEQLHLIEGHTRLGVLIGQLRLGEVQASSTHEVYRAVTNT